MRASASEVSRERSTWFISRGVKQSVNFFARKTSVIDFSLPFAPHAIEIKAENDFHQNVYGYMDCMLPN